MSDHESNLTDSVDEENFISLLQYRDAYHILNLTPPSESGSTSAKHSLSPEIIQKAYNTAKDQAMLALEQFEAKRQTNSHNGGRNMFFISHQNYLELKLQALDQAYGQLMPPVKGMIIEKRDEVFAEEVDFDSPKVICLEAEVEKGDESISAEKFLKVKIEESLPNIPDKRKFIFSDNPNNVVASTSDTVISLQQEEDELDTIDIYFRSTTQFKKGLDPISRHRTNTPNSENPSDVSSCTWDGSSIFSLISQTKKSWEDVASEGGLTDVLGPKTSAHTHTRDGMVSELKTQSHRENAGKPTNRPSVEVNCELNAKKQLQISPTSVTNFPSSAQNENNDENMLARRSKAKLDRGNRRSGRHNSLEATEAARMGILRALSEDNSECLSLDDEHTDDYNNFYSDSINNQGSSRGAKMNKYNLLGGNRNSVGRVNAKKISKNQWKSSQLPPYKSSAEESIVTNNSQPEDHSTFDTRSCSDAIELKDRNAGYSSFRERSTSARLSNSRRQQTKCSQSNHSQYESLVQNGIVGALDLADEFCTVMNNCWKNNGVISSPNVLAKTLSRAGTVATAAFDAAANELERSAQPLDRSRVEDDSTMYSRSTYDGDSAFRNRSVYTTDGESTSFNTLSSFSQQVEPATNMLENRQRASAKASANGPDPPARMLV